MSAGASENDLCDTIQLPQKNHQITFVHSLRPAASDHEFNKNRSLVRSHTAKLPRYKSRRADPKRGSPKKIPSGRKKTQVSDISSLESLAPLCKQDSTAGSGGYVLQTPQRAISEPAVYCYPSSILATSYEETKRQEGRSLHFFILNTAKDWAGWHDAVLWQSLVPQISTVHDCLHHGLVALGAYHESVHVGAYDTHRSIQLKMLSVSQGRKAVNLFVKSNLVLPASVRLVMYVVLSALNFFFQPTSYVQSLILQHEFEEQLDTIVQSTSPPSNIPCIDWLFIMQFLKPTLERQRSKYVQAVDMVSTLKNAPINDFDTEGQIYVPKAWVSLPQALKVLEAMLKKTAFQIKTGLSSSTLKLLDEDPLINEWMSSLDRFAATQKLSARQRLTVRILRVTAKISTIAIMTMNIDNELIFDRFTHVYCELADVLRAAVKMESTIDAVGSTSKFGLENSLVLLCANTANRFCRCPTLREDIIQSLRTSNRTEATDAAGAWAEICAVTRNIEEQGISPPPRSCHDIPRQNRRRLIRCNFYMDSRLTRMDYLRYPYRSTDVEEYWTKFDGYFNFIMGCPAVEYDDTCLPNMTYGRGFFSILRPGNSRQFYTISNPKFYFNIPTM